MPSLTSIRPARSEDAPFILAALAGAPNPPYMQEQHVQEWLDDPALVVYVNEESREFIAIHVDEEIGLITLLWLLPMRLGRLHELRALSLAAEKAVLEQYPHAARWRYRATFQTKDKAGNIVLADGGEALCRAWHGVYGVTTVRPADLTTREMQEGIWEIVTTLGDCTRARARG